tara:strand:+ start:612 stop:1247 length:636 start_codon:yes stop_codon:yes gene_type:complete
MTYDYLYKLILVGDCDVGKTALCQRWNNNKFTADYTATIGIDFNVAHVIIKGGDKIKCQLWDTAGQETFESIIQSYYRGVAGAILVFDITNKQSFERLSYWLEEIKKNKQREMDVPKIILGNKLDNEDKRQVSKEEANAFARRNDAIYIETTAKDNVNLREALEKICEKIYHEMVINDYSHGISKVSNKKINENDSFDDVFDNLFSCCKIN